MNIYYEPVNLTQWHMFEKVKAVGHEEPFLATSTMEVGDLVLLHVGQQDKRYESGVYAYGKIIEGPFILRDHPTDYCNNKLSVTVRITAIDYSHPYISHDACKRLINQFRTVHKIDPCHYQTIMKFLGLAIE